MGTKNNWVSTFYFHSLRRKNMGNLPLHIVMIAVMTLPDTKEELKAEPQKLGRIDCLSMIRMFKASENATWQSSLSNDSSLMDGFKCSSSQPRRYMISRILKLLH